MKSKWNGQKIFNIVVALVLIFQAASMVDKRDLLDTLERMGMPSDDVSVWEEYLGDQEEVNGHFEAGETLNIDKLVVGTGNFRIPPLEVSYYRATNITGATGYGMTVVWDTTQFEACDITLNSDGYTFTTPTYADQRLYMIFISAVDVSGTSTMSVRAHVDGTGSAPMFESLATAQVASGWFPLFLDGNSSFVIQASNADSHNMHFRMVLMRVR